MSILIIYLCIYPSTLFILHTLLPNLNICCLYIYFFYTFFVSNFCNLFMLSYYLLSILHILLSIHQSILYAINFIFFILSIFFTNTFYLIFTYWVYPSHAVYLFCTKFLSFLHVHSIYSSIPFIYP